MKRSNETAHSSRGSGIALPRFRFLQSASSGCLSLVIVRRRFNLLFRHTGVSIFRPRAYARTPDVLEMSSGDTSRLLRRGRARARCKNSARLLNTLRNGKRAAGERASSKSLSSCKVVQLNVTDVCAPRTWSTLGVPRVRRPVREL